MNRDFVKGINIALGILLVFSVVGLVSAVGFHYASEVLPGTFSGDFVFDGDVNITTGNDMCLEGGNCLSDVETDPTVLSSVKDGVSWSEIQSMPSDFSNGDVSWSELSGKPAGFADGVDDTGVSSCSVTGFTNCQNREAWAYYVPHPNVCPGNKVLRGMYSASDTSWMYCCDIVITCS